MEDGDALTFSPLQDNEDDLGSLEETDVCVICSQTLENSLLLVCLHSICRNCVSSQTTEHIKCPRCRSTSACMNLTKDYLHSSEPPGPKVWDNEQLVVDISTIISKSRGRIKACNENVNKLTNNLGDIHEERENLKRQIEATFNTFKLILEECKTDSLLQLENAHNEKELNVMDLLQDLNMSQNNLDHTINYVGKIMKEFPNTEALSILPMAKVQLESNLRHLESLAEKEEPPSLVWKTNSEQFRKISRDCFGSLVDSSVMGIENLVIPDVAQQDVIKFKEPYTKAITNVDQKRQQKTMDLLSPIVADQGFVSPGDQHSLLCHDLITTSCVTPTTLQVPIFPGPGQDSLSVPRAPRSHGPIGSSLSSPAHKIYSSGRMGNSHPDLYRGHTPPPYGRGHTPPLLGRGHTPPLVGRGITPPLLGQDIIAPPPRNDYSFVQLAEKIQRSNSGPINPNFTLADLISNVSEAQTKDWEDPSQAYSNLTALAKLDELQEKKNSAGSWSVDPNLLIPDMDRTTLSRSLSALTSGQLSPVPPSVSPLCGLGVPGMDPRGTSPISPIDSLMPSMSGLSVSPVPPPRGNRAVNVMQVRCKFGTLGPGKGQFNSPHGFCLGLDEEIIVADTNNHRIQIFEKNGTFRSQFGVPGKEEGHLWYPRKVAVMKTSGNFVICDRGNERSRMQIFNRHGNFMRKIAIRYIDIVAGLAITREGQVVAVDSVTPTVFVIAEDGELVRWFDCADYMREPSDIAVSGTEFFVCDFKGHTVVIFSENGQFQRKIGLEHITLYPNGIDVSDFGDVLIGDSHGNRFHVAVFGSDGTLLGEFECPHVKVSRCCGLKITREGYVVTLAKNNHHVLVLNTLYIT